MQDRTIHSRTLTVATSFRAGASTTSSRARTTSALVHVESEPHERRKLEALASTGYAVIVNSCT